MAENSPTYTSTSPFWEGAVGILTGPPHSNSTWSCMRDGCAWRARGDDDFRRFTQEWTHAVEYYSRKLHTITKPKSALGSFAPLCSGHKPQANAAEPALDYGPKSARPSDNECSALPTLRCAEGLPTDVQWKGLPAPEQRQCMPATQWPLARCMKTPLNIFLPQRIT